MTHSAPQVWVPVQPLRAKPTSPTWLAIGFRFSGHLATWTRSASTWPFDAVAPTIASSGCSSFNLVCLGFSKTQCVNTGYRFTYILCVAFSGTHLDHTASKISFTDFIDKELILFSLADNLRVRIALCKFGCKLEFQIILIIQFLCPGQSIPSVVDGLKISQRKVLFACLKRNLTRELKVAQLAGYVSEQTGFVVQFSFPI